MKSFKLKLEGPAGCGKDTFMDLVVDKLKDKYNITNKKVSITEMGENQGSSTVKNMEHEWRVELKTEAKISKLKMEVASILCDLLSELYHELRKIK